MISILAGPFLTASRPGMMRLISGLIPTEGVAQLGNITTQPFRTPKVLPALAADLAGHYNRLSHLLLTVLSFQNLLPKMGLQHFCLRGFIPHDKKTTPS